MSEKEQIIFEPGDIAIVTQTIPWANRPIEIRESLPFLFGKKFHYPVGTYADGERYYLNRWLGIMGEKEEIFSWPNNTDEMLEKYCIAVFKTQTKTHQVFKGKCKPDKFRGELMVSLYRDHHTGLFAPFPPFPQIV